MLSQKSATILRLLLLPILCCLPSYALDAPSLTGTWVSVRDKLDDGNYFKVYYQLEQRGDSVTGTVTYPWGVLHLSQGKVEGAHFHFLQGFGAKPFTVDGVIAGKELRFTAAEYGEAAQAHTAQAIAPAEIPAYKRMDLPAPHPVPQMGAARTPPMGWNSWNKFRNKVDDKVVRQMADILVSSGMKNAGYIYINIDDTWQGSRDAQGAIQPNYKFPDMKALADYVHSKGLKLGIYSSPGPKTCGGYEGSYGHEAQDAQTYAAWGIDYLKYDWCSAGKIYDKKEVQAVYQVMGQALADTGRPIVFSLCEYGMEDPWKWGPQVGGNLWRTTGDISDNWSSLAEIGFSQSELAPYAGPGHWNDPDMLEVGNGGMTEDEYRTHISLWSLLAAPLLAGNDLRAMSPATKSILMNPDVLAIDQDTLGKQAERQAKSGDQQVWVKPLADGGVAVGLFNLGASPALLRVTTASLNLDATAKAQDVWKHTEVKSEDGKFSATVPSHGVLLLRVSTGAIRVSQQ